MDLVALSTISGEQYSTKEISEAYNFCKEIATSHYENFPVASLLIPKELRKFFYSIYAFSRIADDISDEISKDSPQMAIECLENYHKCLQAISNNINDVATPTPTTNPIFLALCNTITESKLSALPFEKLLMAFKSDISFQQPKTLEDLMKYCEYSANPVGEILLRLFNEYNEQTSRYSDRICSALQIVNHLQDLTTDMNRGRCYIPMDMIETNDINSAQLQLLDIARDMFIEGKHILPLIHNFRFRLELRLIICGGKRALRNIKPITQTLGHQ